MPQSKFGGVAVKEQSPNARGGSKFGGIAVDDKPDLPLQEQPQPQTIGHGLSEFGKQINPLPMITGALQMIAHPWDTYTGIAKSMQDERAKAGKLWDSGHYVESVGHAGAGLVPLIGPPAAKIGEQTGGTPTRFDKYGKVVESGKPPDITGGINSGAGLITSMLAAPKVTEGAGRLIKATARPIVKSALGLPSKAEAYGANPAEAVLRDTKGIRPSTIARTGREKLTDLSKELDTAASNATAKPSLTPARNILNRESVSSAAANSEQTPREIARMSKQLTEVRPGFKGDTEFAPGAHTPISFQSTNTGLVGPSGQPIAGTPRLVRGTSPEPLVAAEQPAKQFLDMKRQFNENHITSWNPNVSTQHSLGVARQAYGAMADELNRTVPGAEKLNSRMQGLIPAVERAEAVSRNAGAMQKAIDRISKPTGALVPALIGRQIGGVPGMLAGLGVPEMISAPAVKMGFARTFNTAGKVLRSPVVKRGSLVAPLLRQER